MNTDEEILKGLKCPYCGGKTEHLQDIVIYGRSFGSMVYICQPCDAYVGCHKPRPTEALGRLANADLRIAKILAHASFDKLWTRKMNQGYSKSKSRKLAYKWLSEQLNIPFKYCHIGMFDVEECEAVVKVCEPFL